MSRPTEHNASRHYTSLADLIACPHCDTLHTAVELPENARAHCKCCSAVLMTNRVDALARILSLAIAAFILMIAAISFPFLDLSAGGRGNSASVISTILAFSEANSLALAIAVAGFIILLPLLRLLAIIYAVGPLVFGLPRTPGALSAFRLSEQLRPWAMAEIFIVGVSIALVKVVGIASVQFGAAFWAFAALVVIIVWKDQIMCRYTVWQELDSA